MTASSENKPGTVLRYHQGGKDAVNCELHFVSVLFNFTAVFSILLDSLGFETMKSQRADFRYCLLFGFVLDG